MIVYSVHRLSQTQISEIELLTAHLALAEDHCKVLSADWPYGKLILASRELDTPGVLRIRSVWERGERIADHGPRGLWRRVQDSPHWFSPPQP